LVKEHPSIERCLTINSVLIQPDFYRGALQISVFRIGYCHRPPNLSSFGVQQINVSAGGRAEEDLVSARVATFRSFWQLWRFCPLSDSVSTKYQSERKYSFHIFLPLSGETVAG